MVNNETWVSYVELPCDICGESMVWDRQTLTTVPPYYRHECPQGHQTLAPRMYPEVISVDITGEY